jgi:Trypsin
MRDGPGSTAGLLTVIGVAMTTSATIARRHAVAAAALFLWSTPAPAIVGGSEHAGPLARATVMVLSSNGGMCSAVVVASDVVLTAAHCATGAEEHRVHYRDETGRPVLIAPEARAVHPGYDAKAVETRRRSIDLALLRLPGPLPARFEPGGLTGTKPSRDAALTVGGYGVALEGDARSTGTFRAASVRAVEPYGESSILLWARADGAGACQGDSGGPITGGGAIAAVTSWSTGVKGRGCGGLTQGILLGPQRDWIDRTLQGWGRAARWH